MERLDFFSGDGLEMIRSQSFDLPFPHCQVPSIWYVSVASAISGPRTNSLGSEQTAWVGAYNCLRESHPVLLVMIQQKDSATPLKDVASSKQESNSDGDSAASALRNLYKDQMLSDLEIEGTDGMRISAHRLILASRSPVFKQLLAGDFSEAKSPVVSLGFEGSVLKAVIEYCYTDEFSFAYDGTEKDREESLVRSAMDLFSAADYFALPKLCDKVMNGATVQM